MTDDRLAGLIRSISGTLEPVSTLEPVTVRVGWWTAVSALSLSSVTWLFGSRSDLALAMMTPALGLQLLMAIVAVFAAIAALRLSVPGADRAGSRFVAVGMLGIWPALLVAWHWLDGGTASTLTAEPLHPICAMTISIIAIAPAVTLTVMIRNGAPLRPLWAATMAGVAAACVGAAGVSLICPISRLPHLLIAHALPTIGAAVFIRAAASTFSKRKLAPLVAGLAMIILVMPALSAQERSGVAAAPHLPLFRVASTTAGYLPSASLLEFLDKAESGAVPHTIFEGRGPILIGAAILFGGLLLNLTPCVLPMIPINLAIIGAGAGATSRRRGWILGGAYGGAMAVVYGLLGGIIAATAGTFGVLNSSPWFNLAIAGLFLVLGLAMFDVVTVDLSRWSGKVRVGSQPRGSVTLAFFMGGIAALLAGACVAPVVIQVVALASQLYAGGSRLALALPLILGVGMGLPWPFAGAGLAALPRPGAWMVRVKQGLGVCILLAATYYGYEGYELSRPVAAPVASANGWYQSLDEGLAEARRSGKPVFLDVWATWCKNCVVMDATTFKDPKVRVALDQYVKVRFQAEDVERPDAAALLDRLDSIGLPTYAVVRPANDE